MQKLKKMFATITTKFINLIAENNENLDVKVNNDKTQSETAQSIDIDLEIKSPNHLWTEVKALPKFDNQFDDEILAAQLIQSDCKNESVIKEFTSQELVSNKESSILSTELKNPQLFIGKIPNVSVSLEGPMAIMQLLPHTQKECSKAVYTSADTINSFDNIQLNTSRTKNILQLLRNNVTRYRINRISKDKINRQKQQFDKGVSNSKKNIENIPRRVSSRLKRFRQYKRRRMKISSNPIRISTVPEHILSKGPTRNVSSIKSKKIFDK
ncbi:hypothetical protein KPH14_012874 [Odynerus spinipes]|uniref:Uncharacterized protein n=1 Tax=Odynerus spinipes TaxID=1348599 RepID=A0AAD9VKC3_9HYME|nr:hypothetical protein KPH14_012874 [Odynerus spinipes]